MNKITYTALLFLMTVVVCGSRVQAQGKNILFLHFEQKHLRQAALPADSIFSVTYRLKCSKPSRFHGFQIDMVFQTSVISFEPTGSDRVIFDGGVAAGAGLHQATYDGMSGDLTVQALASGSSFDTSNHLLFQYRALVKNSLKDSASILISRVDAGKSDDPSVDSGIDTVIVDATVGNPDLGWGPLAVVYLDSTPVVPRKKYPVTLLTDGVSMQSDSSRDLIVSWRGKDSANVRNGSFRCTLDTSLVTLTSVRAGSVLSAGSLADSSGGDSIEVHFSSTSPIPDSGSFLVLGLRAKHRTDTSCFSLADPQLVLSDSDKYVSSVSYVFGEICVLGQRPDTNNSAVVAPPASQEWRIVTTDEGLLLIGSEAPADGPAVLRVFSIGGALLAQMPVTSSEALLPLRLSSGSYVAYLSDAHGKRVREFRFSIVH